MESEKNIIEIYGLPTETTIKIKNLIRQEFSKGEKSFIELIHDSKFQFLSGHSYRMLNYYSNEFMLRAKRNSQQGKRRLSFFDLHALRYLIDCRPKTSKVNSIKFNELLEVVFPKYSEESQILSQFELQLMISLVLLGISDVSLKTSDFDSKNKYLKLKYNLSDAIVASLKDLDYQNDRNQEFITTIIYEVDKIRSVLKLKVLIEENLKEIKKAPFITKIHKNRALDVLPEFLRPPISNEFSKYSYVYKHDDGMVYGMAIKKLGHEDYLTPEEREKFNYSFEDLIKRFE